MTVNIYDIARKSGVSIATVSRVLNNNPGVRRQTREAVLAVMEQEGYTPNAFARGLGLGSMHLVGVLCTDVRDAFYATAVGYVEEYLRLHNMNTILRCTGSDLEEKKRGLAYVLRQKVDAVVLIGSAFREESDNAHLKAAAEQVPVIIINGCIPMDGVYCVASDEHGAAKDVINKLIQRQKKDILLLHDADTYSCQQKIAGYREAYAENGLTYDPQRIIRVDRDMDAVNACIKRLLMQNIHFDAVIGTEDILALAAQKALQRIGLSSMPVVGFNNSVLARCATPEITSIDNEVGALCSLAMHTLTDLLDGKTPPQQQVIPAKLVERDSFRYR